MINLQDKYENDYKLVWFDGEEISIPLPTQSLLTKMVKLLNIQEDDVETQINSFFEIFKEVMKSNKNDRKFTDEELNEVPFNIVQMIMEDYTNSVF